MPNLPCETLDHIVDFLHDSQTTLRDCCLVSKSWVARTRKNLFAEVEFQTAENLESWKTMFPDPSTSPAHYTKALLIGSPKIVEVIDVEAGSWIKGFSRVVHLAMVGQLGEQLAFGWEAAYVQFCGFSSVIKSLRMDHIVFPSPLLSNLILSFPLLEDLSITDRYRTWTTDEGYLDGLSIAIKHSSLPVFTGSLELLLRGGMKLIVRQWLPLPGGIHFRKLTLTWFCEEDISLTMALVENCSHTLESLYISYESPLGALPGICVRTEVTYVSFQVIQSRLRSTFRGQQNSGMWCFGPNH